MIWNLIRNIIIDKYDRSIERKINELAKYEAKSNDKLNSSQLCQWGFLAGKSENSMNVIAGNKSLDLIAHINILPFKPAPSKNLVINSLTNKVTISKGTWGGTSHVNNIEGSWEYFCTLSSNIAIWGSKPILQLSCASNWRIKIAIYIDNLPWGCTILDEEGWGSSKYKGYMCWWKFGNPQYSA